jgi:hypothetical protein
MTRNIHDFVGCVLLPCVTAVLTLGAVRGQTVDPEVARMAEAYRSGDADAAVAFFAGRKTYELPSGDDTRRPRTERDSALIGLLFTTEVGMRLRTFGKYALSAPLGTTKDGIIGLNGAFELNSFRVYGSLRLQSGAAGLTDAERPRSEAFNRQWHVVAISHCMRWQIDCADTLLASAQRYFPEAADVLVLTSAMAEARGQSSNAQELLLRALTVDRNHASAHLRLGRLLADAGRPDDAGRELNLAFEGARVNQNRGAMYFALMSLADLDARSGRTTNARSRRAEATALRAFSHPYFSGLEPTAIYRAGLFYEQPWRIAALRKLAR